MGIVSVSELAEGFTLLAMANALLKAVLMSSKDQVSGSLGSLVHLMVICPPDVGASGIERISAEAKGATRARAQSLENIWIVRRVVNGFEVAEGDGEHKNEEKRTATRRIYSSLDTNMCNQSASKSF